MNEVVVLVDEQNNVLGTASKEEVHTQDTPLHRAFSLFLFNSQGQLLITKRAATKKTFPGIWTNTVCGHPGPGGSNTEAAKRRLKDELGIDLDQGSDLKVFQGLTSKEGSGLGVLKGLSPMSIKEVAPYRYRFTDQNGIVENEICPILVGYSNADPKPDPDEVEDWKWMDWQEFLAESKAHPEQYSPWSREEAAILASLHLPK